ncbi:MAG: Ldh family oxidoreductase, partial [Candidatus Izimaplasma sp.]|nr:Ldh family oxidoreductase [Candidatus Izimaplasma bacterium]
MGTNVNVSWEFIEDFMIKAFKKVGVPEKDAMICADVLMESDKRGIDSHGINRFKPIYIDRILDKIQNPKTKIDILKETATTVVMDANDGMGMVASHKAMQTA